VKSLPPFGSSLIAKVARYGTLPIKAPRAAHG